MNGPIAKMPVADGGRNSRYPQGFLAADDNPPSRLIAVRRSISASTSLAICRSSAPGCRLGFPIAASCFERRRANQTRPAATTRATTNSSRMGDTKSKASAGSDGGSCVGPGSSGCGVDWGACGAFKKYRIKATALANPVASPASQRAAFGGAAGAVDGVLGFLS